MHLDCILSMSFMQLRPFLNNRFFSAETVNLTPTVSLLKRHGVFFVELRLFTKYEGFDGVNR